MKTKDIVENSETRAVKISRNSLAWEKLGIKFRQSQSIGFSLEGKFSQPKLHWTAWHKGEYLVGGGSEIEDLTERLNQKQERYIAIIAKRNSRK